MKRPMAAAVALAVLTWAGHAVAENGADPTGTWKWRLSNQSADNTLKLRLEGNKLTGSMLRRTKQEEVPIEEATCKVGMVSFKVNVTSERGDGLKIVIKFTGTVSGDRIKGTIEFKHPDRTISRDWDARRVEKQFPRRDRMAKGRLETFWLQTDPLPSRVDGC